jgi:hypothetical protein
MHSLGDRLRLSYATDAAWCLRCCQDKQAHRFGENPGDRLAWASEVYQDFQTYQCAYYVFEARVHPSTMA